MVLFSERAQLPTWPVAAEQPARTEVASCKAKQAQVKMLAKAARKNALKSCCGLFRGNAVKTSCHKSKTPEVIQHSTTSGGAYPSVRPLIAENSTNPSTHFSPISEGRKPAERSLRDDLYLMEKLSLPKQYLTRKLLSGARTEPKEE